MPAWPATRVTLLDRIRNPQDQEAWAEFVGLYGPLVVLFVMGAPRRFRRREAAFKGILAVITTRVRSRLGVGRRWRHADW